MIHPINPARQSNQSQHSQPPRCTSLYSRAIIAPTPPCQPSTMLIRHTQRIWDGRLLTAIALIIFLKTSRIIYRIIQVFMMVKL